MAEVSYKFLELCSHQQSLHNLNKQQFQAQDLTPSLDFGKVDTTIIFGLSDLFDSTTFNSKKYGSFKLIQGEQNLKLNETTGAYQYELMRTRIPYSFCNPNKTGLSQINLQVQNQFQLDHHFCSDFNNLTIQGLSSSKHNKKVYIEYSYCFNRSYCANQSEMEYFFKNAYLKLYQVSEQYNPDNYTFPITKFLKLNQYLIHQQSILCVDFEIINNTLTRQDSILGLRQKSIENFVSWNKLKDEKTLIQQGSNYSNKIFSATIQYGDTITQYERKVKTINQVLGELGGFYTFVFFIFYAIFTPMKEILIFSSLISSSYCNLQNEDNSVGSNQLKQTIRSKCKKSKQKLDENEVLFINEKLKKKDYVKFGFLSLFSILIKSIFCFRQNLDKLKSKFDIYKAGKQLLFKELDCIHFINTVRKIKFLYKLQLNKTQRLIAKTTRNYDLFQYHKNKKLKNEKQMSQEKQEQKIISKLMNKPLDKQDKKLISILIDGNQNNQQEKAEVFPYRRQLANVNLQEEDSKEQNLKSYLQSQIQEPQSQLKRQNLRKRNLLDSTRQIIIKEPISQRSIKNEDQSYSN